MSSNPETELARQYIEFTSQNVFLTGKAGTGKTTFLRQLRESQPKRMAVVAPTGVAAINAQGVTIHSFFQIAPGLFMPGSTNTAEQRKNYYRMSEQKKNILRTLDLLVIDEISMVRCDLLDAIDSTLRSYRDRTKPFGGVQLLFIGDLQQLAPVAKDEEWNILKTQYETPYFFSSHAMQQTSFVTIELKKIYRQDDSRFIDLLAQIRTNTLSDASIDLLNQRCLPNYVAPDDEEWIHLTTHNSTANAFNNNKLALLNGKTQTFKAHITGNFPETSYPADCQITLRIGAQVMFIKNDSSGRHEYYNGKIGKIVDFVNDTVMVKCKDRPDPITVTTAEWTNTRYEIDSNTGELKETFDGTFRQIPLRLAWAITIHKSQGLTFDHAVIDINHSFAHGQAYVALSRCRSLDGLVLSKPIYRSSIICDPQVENYITQSIDNSTNSRQQLPTFKQQYFIELLNELFDFSSLGQALTHLMEIVKRYAFLSQQNFVEVLEQAEHLFNNDMPIYSLRFSAQYSALAATSPDLVHNEALQKRIKAAAQYFLTQICDSVTPLLLLSKLTFSNQLAKKQFTNALKQLTLATKIKISTLHTAIKDGMTVKSFLNSKAVAEILDLSKGFDPSTPTQTEPLAKNEDTAGKPSKKTKNKDATPKEPKTPTHHVTLQLYNEGLSFAEIAKQRNLTINSIEKHVVKLIEEGKINVDDIVTPQHRELITRVMQSFATQPLLKEIKEKLPDSITYMEIQAVRALKQTTEHEN